MILSTPAMSFAVVLMVVLMSGVLIYVLIRAAALLPLDIPNHRSLHRRPVPKAGGVVIVILAMAGIWSMVEFDYQFARHVFWGAAILAVVSLWDDFGHILPFVRLVVHGIAAVILVSGVATEWSLWVAFAVAILVVWLINLYNFMDGMDGLAGAMAVCGFGALGVLGYLDRNEQYAMAMLIIAGASAGFLLFNLPPAKVFMGDVGSTFLGYMVAAASIRGVVDDIFPWWAPVLIFLPFWLDATITLLRRLLQGERIWEAHCSHFYQRAVLAGIPVRRVLLVEVLVMIVCSGLAITGVYLVTNGR